MGHEAFDSATPESVLRLDNLVPDEVRKEDTRLQGRPTYSWKEVDEK